MVDYSRQLEAEEEPVLVEAVQEEETPVLVGEQPAEPELKPAVDPATIDAQKVAVEAAQAAEQIRVSRQRIKLPSPTADGVPEWVHLPAGMKFPKGKQVIFLRFRASMTDTPHKGERQAIVWSCNLGDQKLAMMRAEKDPNKLADELTKQMVRGVDGYRADWTGNPVPANIDIWWDEIGPKCRNILDKIFAQLHVASQAEAVDFFESCVAVRVVAG